MGHYFQLFADDGVLVHAFVDVLHIERFVLYALYFPEDVAWFVGRDLVFAYGLTCDGIKISRLSVCVNCACVLSCVCVFSVGAVGVWLFENIIQLFQYIFGYQFVEQGISPVHWFCIVLRMFFDSVRAPRSWWLFCCIYRDSGVVKSWIMDCAASSATWRSVFSFRIFIFFLTLVQNFSQRRWPRSSRAITILTHSLELLPCCRTSPKQIIILLWAISSHSLFQLFTVLLWSQFWISIFPYKFKLLRPWFFSRYGNISMTLLQKCFCRYNSSYCLVFIGIVCICSFLLFF